MFDSYVYSLILKTAGKYKVMARCYFQTKLRPSKWKAIHK